MNICFVFRVWDGVKVCKICLRPIPILNIHVKVVYRVIRFFGTHFWTFTWWLCTLFVKVVWALFWIFSLGGCAQRRESLMRLKIVCWSLYLMGGSIREHFHWPWFCQQGSSKSNFSCNPKSPTKHLRIPYLFLKNSPQQFNKESTNWCYSEQLKKIWFWMGFLPTRIIKESFFL